MKPHTVKILLLLIASFPMVNPLESFCNRGDKTPAANAVYAAHPSQVESNGNILICLQNDSPNQAVEIDQYTEETVPLTLLSIHRPCFSALGRPGVAT